MNRTIAVWSAVVGVLVLVALFKFGQAPGADIPFSLLFGWIQFINMVFPQVHVRTDGLIVAGVALVLFVGVAHYLARWFHRELQPEDTPAVQRVWRIRWTLSLTAILILMFVAGISLVGITHQTIWLAGADEPLRKPVLAHQGRVKRGIDLKMIGLGFHNHADAEGGGLPGDLCDRYKRPLHSWATRILPYMNYSTNLDMSVPWNGPENSASFMKPLPELLNPDLRLTRLQDDDGFWYSHYAANEHVLGHGDFPRENFADGNSNAILLGEVNDRFSPWGKPGNFRDPTLGLNKSPNGFGGAKGSRGVTFLMADGSVRFVADVIEPRALKALSCPGKASAEDSSGAEK